MEETCADVNEMTVSVWHRILSVQPMTLPYRQCLQPPLYFVVWKLDRTYKWSPKCYTSRTEEHWATRQSSCSSLDAGGYNCWWIDFNICYSYFGQKRLLDYNLYIEVSCYINIYILPYLTKLLCETYKFLNCYMKVTDG